MDTGTKVVHGILPYECAGCGTRLPYEPDHITPCVECGEEHPVYQAWKDEADVWCSQVRNERLNQ